MKKSEITFFLFVIFLLGQFSLPFAQEKHYYFYRPQIAYGSEITNNPLVTFFNGSYDVLRNGARSNKGETMNVFKLDYETGVENVWRNISSPLHHISRYGWNRFLKQEVFPASPKKDKAQWVPNYGHHIIGSGMLWVRMAEWYDYHRVPNPYLCSFITTTAYQFLNEVLENNHSQMTNVDPIADLLIFNPLGFLLFSSDEVRKFFSQTVSMYDWSLQPVFNPRNRHLENAGLQFTFKYRLNWTEHYSAFFYFGIYGIGGLTYTHNKEHNFSFGIGTVVNRLNENVVHNSRLITPTTDGALGFFYDKKHSLLTSLIVTGPRLYNARINIYPGFFDWNGFRPGMYLAFGEWDHFLIGISVAHFPIGMLTNFK